MFDKTQVIVDIFYCQNCYFEDGFTRFLLQYIGALYFKCVIFLSKHIV